VSPHVSSANFGRAAWDLLRDLGLARYGTETMHVLRAEKGFIVVGQETDGTVTPGDLGLEWTVGRHKRDFVGKRSLTRPDIMRDDRLRLVGLLTDDPRIVLEEGAQLIESGSVSLGHVTSSYHSATLGRSIALAMLSGGSSRMGTKLRVPLGDGSSVAVTVTAPVFYDAAGERMTRPIGLDRTEHREHLLVQTAVDLPAVSPCPEAELTLLPGTNKFNVRTAEPLTAVLQAAGHAGFTALWLGPDEYLVLTAGTPSLTADSIVDVSHRTVGIRVDGPRAGWCVNAFCALDLDAIPDNGCTRTLFGKAEIVLWRRGEQAFHIETARSFAPYVWACLQEARREFLPPLATC
jgi:sarcosine oxidase subunit alpha